MPFSRTLKASLVALVLIILTAVPQLDAAPMFPVPTAWPDLYKGAEQAGQLVDEPVNLELTLAPPGERGGSSLSIGSPASSKSVAPSPRAAENLGQARGYGVPSHPAVYAQPTGAQHGQMLNNQARGQNAGYVVPRFVPGYSMPYGNPAGVYDRQVGGQPRGFGDRIVHTSFGTQNERPGVSLVPNPQAWSHTGASGAHDAGPSYSTAARTGDGHPSTSDDSPVTMPLDASSRSTTFGHTRVKGQPWSNDDIEAILDGDDWKRLRLDEKMGYLNSFGERVFTVDYYNQLPVLEGNKNWKKIDKGDRLTQKLVKEYLKVRVERDTRRALKIDWSDGAIPEARQFWDSLGTTFPKQVRPKGWSTSYDPFTKFRLGIFSIKAIGERSASSGRMIWNKLQNNKKDVPLLNVVARTDKGGKAYIGKFKVEQAK